MDKKQTKQTKQRKNKKGLIANYEFVGAVSAGPPPTIRWTKQEDENSKRIHELLLMAGDWVHECRLCRGFTELGPLASEWVLADTGKQMMELEAEAGAMILAAMYGLAKDKADDE